MDGLLIYQDYALDLLVFPDGRQEILDEEEFSALKLSSRKKKLALAALAELQKNLNNIIRESN